MPIKTLKRILNGIKNIPDNTLFLSPPLNSKSHFSKTTFVSCFIPYLYPSAILPNPPPNTFLILLCIHSHLQTSQMIKGFNIFSDGYQPEWILASHPETSLSFPLSLESNRKRKMKIMGTYYSMIKHARIFSIKSTKSDSQVGQTHSYTTIFSFSLSWSKPKLLIWVCRRFSLNVFSPS